MTQRIRWRRGVLDSRHAGSSDGVVCDTTLATPTTQARGSVAPTQHCQTIGTVEEYISELKHQLEHGQLDLRGAPRVQPPNIFHRASLVNEQRQRKREPEISAAEALQLALLPATFVWAPTVLIPGHRMRCPACRMPASSWRWLPHRALHDITGQQAYITTEHVCNGCTASPLTSSGPPPAKRTKQRKKFQADSAEAIALLPTHTACMWTMFNTGRGGILCEAAVVDFVRALATRTSWSAIADTLNELRATAWVREVTMRYLRLCEYLRIAPSNVPRALSDTHYASGDWVRSLYMRDANIRRAEVTQELIAERGDDIMVIDWTHDAASRCRNAFLLNVMDGDRRILLSAFTATCVPSAARPLMHTLAARGVHPQIVYVDDDCCDAWPKILRELWPRVHVRLDGMHAMMRITKTTACKHHPWYSSFCAALAEGIYTYDGSTLARLTRARARAGLSGSLPGHARSKYVPRVIEDATLIAAAVGATIDAFSGCHEAAGPLLTSKTHAAWACLRVHVDRGCLCDPDGMRLHTLGASVQIGGESFSCIRTLRGSSALEGFHTHQKHWLGPLARHAADAGSAILADGTLRWNRRRRIDTSSTDLAPLVFASGLLRDADALHRQLTGRRLSLTLPLS